MRTAGILMPLTSLPSPYGVGTMGQAARDFIAFLHKAGQTYWQMLPICPTSYGDSPYQTSCSYAGNPYMIDLDDLSDEGLLDPSDEKEYKNICWGEDPTRVDYDILYQHRFQVLEKACHRAYKKLHRQYESFYQKESYWLDDYSLFMAVKDHFQGKSWVDWPREVRFRQEHAIESLKEELKDRIQFYRVLQFLFFRQWFRLKRYANRKQIKIIGDLPIYTAMDSSDVWSEPKQFQLDDQLLPIEVAGCPPDGFSKDGQLWGNPLFCWERMKEDHYDWWVRRMRHHLQIYDVIRIDHFRGFDSYYAIPAKDTTARNGTWKKGPGMALFTAMKESLGDLPIIAEDLGVLTESVYQLLADTGFPGMKVLEFAFDHKKPVTEYLPYSYPRNCVVYTGTHDNDTILGWFDHLKKADAKFTVDYLRLTKEEGYHWGMMRCAWASVADTAIMQMADLLGQHSEGRINTPSTIGDNWKWRCLTEDITDELAAKVYQDMKRYGRLRQKIKKR